MASETLLPRLISQPLYPELKYDCCVIGIGRLGLCFALTLERIGLRVCGVDVNPDYISKINEKTLSSDEPGLEKSLQESINFHATTCLNVGVQNSKVSFILVPTPTDGGKYYYDHGILSNILVRINNLEVSDKIIVVNSTLFPGYIRRIGRTLLRNCLRCSLNYNPAFVAQGDVMTGYRTGGWFGMVLVGAEDEQAKDILCSIYRRIPRAQNEGEVNICCMSPESAEICKLASNCFRTTKISFANMIGDIADKSEGADKFDICDALKCDKSIGPICMTPGYGYGGPCYPRDNKALALYARGVGVAPLIPVATDEYNDIHHQIMTTSCIESGNKIYEFFDVTYKPNCAVPMIDKSPKLEVACSLARKGLKVKIIDRFPVIMEVMKEYGDLFEYETCSSESTSKISTTPNGVY